jgi:hypothetical protein
MHDKLVDGKKIKYKGILNNVTSNLFLNDEQ